MDNRLTDNLLNRFGSPLYVFDETEFIENYKALCKAFREVYPNYNPGYSYKTNYTPYICGLVKELGGYAEVVSDMELHIARKLGYEYKDIIYNGPAKGPELEALILQGGMSNIDNESEADRIIELARKHPDVLMKVGIRINTDIGAGYISRFGVDADSDDLGRIVAKIKAENNLRLVGVHLHISRARNLAAWKRRIDNALRVADEYIEGIPEYIDLGSGMFADMEDSLKQQFTIDVPTHKEYARVVAGTMSQHYASSDIKPQLITEPGTTLVSRYLSILTQVTAVKTVKGRNVAVVDSDVHNVGETAQMMKVPYSHYQSGTGSPLAAPLDITGYTCLEQDVLYKDFPHSVKVGDIIEFRNIGGYSVVYKPPFIQPNCAMVSVSGDGTFKEIKRRETFDDILVTYKFR